MNAFATAVLRAVLVTGLWWAARAERVTFTLDPARSSISLGGSVSGIALQEQAAGSLTTSYEGSIVAEVSPTLIEFVGGTRMTARELNSWQPGPNGAEGTASASYGAKGHSGGFFAIDALAASRRLLFDVTSSPLALSGGTFDAAALVFQFVDTNNCVLDYRVTGVFNDAGSKVLSGLATNSVTGSSSLTTVDGVETLKIAVSASFTFELVIPGDTTLTLTGELVATRGAAPEPPVVVVTPPPPGATSMNLSWSSSYKLQRATQLEPTNWADFATDSPVTIPFAGPGEFFRVVPK